MEKFLPQKLRKYNFNYFFLHSKLHTTTDVARYCTQPTWKWRKHLQVAKTLNLCYCIFPACSKRSFVRQIFHRAADVFWYFGHCRFLSLSTTRISSVFAFSRFDISALLNCIKNSCLCIECIGELCRTCMEPCCSLSNMRCQIPNWIIDYLLQIFVKRNLKLPLKGKTILGPIMKLLCWELSQA